MRRFKTILLVMPSAEAGTTAIDRCIDLAKANNANVRLLAVDEMGDGVLGQALRALGFGQELLEDVRARRATALEETALRISDAGVTVTACKRRGKAFIEVIREAMACRADLIMAGVVSPSGPPSSFDLHLMRKAPCPVWLVRPGMARIGQILCAVDPQPDDKTRMDLAHSNLRLALSLAEHERAALTVVHCWMLESESTLRDSAFAGIREAELEALIKVAEDGAHDRLQRLSREYDLDAVGAELMVRKEDASNGIILAAQEVSADLVIMGTIGRSGVPGLLIGNTAETVLSAVPCSVVAVKPEGFETPVEPDMGLPVASSILSLAPGAI